MTLTPNQKKWLKRLLIPLCIILVLRGLLYYVVTYRFNDIIQLVIKKESKGLYSFNASDIKFSLWKKNIILSDVVLHCTDTLNTSPHHDISIPKVYLGLKSWTDIILHQQVLVDSLDIVLPSLTTHEHSLEKTNHKNFQASKILELVQKLVQHLEVKSLNLQNGSFTYSNLKSPGKFASSQINLVVKNFSKKKKGADNLLSSDDIDLAITNQHWIFPDGLHEISFSKLHFSGRDKYFELDSCLFRSETPGKNAFLTLNADKIRFTSKQLSAIYEQEELLIDTLICFRPELHIQTSQLPGAKPKGIDSVSISQSVQQFFKGISFKYVDIHDGSFLVNERNTLKPTYATRKTNLKIYNLAVHPETTPHLTTDSVQLSLDNIQFYTADSLYQMSINQFTLKNNDVIFKDAVFSPTKNNHGNKDLVFRTPLLRLRNINLEDLVRKKLNASAAELYDPLIVIDNRKKIKSKPYTLMVSEKQTKTRISNFYKSLHELGELISVHDFKIINGNIHYESSGAQPMIVEMKNINTDILLDHFLSSDSFMNIKRSLTELRVGEIIANLPKIQLHVSNYTFKGGYRHNYANDFRLSLANNTTLTGKKLYWEIFDWDMLQNHRIILIESLKAKEIIADVHQPGNATQIDQSKDLPVMQIRRIDIENLAVNLETSRNDSLQLNGQAICLDEISTKEKSFVWGNLTGQFNNTRFHNENLSAVIGKISINNGSENIIEDGALEITGHSSSTKIIMPVTKINADIHSSDFSRLKINSFISENPQIEVYNNAILKIQPAKSLTIPIELETGRFVISNSKFHYTSINKNDTLVVDANMDIRSEKVHLFKDEKKIVEYDKMGVDISNVRMIKKGLTFFVPQSSIELTGGNAAKNTGDKLSFNSGTKITWLNAECKISNSDNLNFSAKKLDGFFDDPSFTIVTGKKMEWQSLINKTAITNSAVNFRNRAISLDAGSFHWNPWQRELSIRDYSLIPNISMEDAFKQASWQADYLYLKGGGLDISGIHFNHHSNDSSIGIEKIILQNLELVTSRDKQKPFRHGIEKMMPTKLIGSIKYPIHIDSVFVNQSMVTVREISLQTHKQGIIPLENINAVITNITNNPGQQDSLSVVAEAKLFNNYIRAFSYKESYYDSLSAFNLHFNTSPMILTEYSQVTTPLAAISVNDGNADTLFTTWRGNKYAAIGKMDFYYKDLKVQLLDKENPKKKSFLLSLENMLANTILLRKKNSKHSRVYFERDKEKFIFNYWVKTSLRGLLSSIGIKSNKKYYKEYLKVRGIYSLPLNED